MKQNTYPVSQSSEPRELVYLNFAVREFIRRACIESWYDMNNNVFKAYNPNRADLIESIISWLYTFGRNEIPWHYDVFKKMILAGVTNDGKPLTYSYDPPKPTWHDKYVRRYRLRHNGRQKYTRKSHHTKKVVDETLQSKRDWRERKAFNRDRLKSRHYCKCGKYGKNIAHSGRRAYEREMIAAGRWDEMQEHKDFFYNSWDAC